MYAAPTCDFAPLPNHQIHADSHSLSLSLSLYLSFLSFALSLSSSFSLVSISLLSSEKAFFTCDFL